MEKMILCLGFGKKQQKYFQEIVKDEVLFFEKTKKGVKKLLKNDLIKLVIVSYKDDEKFEWIEFAKKNKFENTLEIWLFTQIKSEYILPAYVSGISDFIGVDWEESVINQKIDYLNIKNALLNNISSKKIKLAGLVINPKKHKVSKKGKDLDLTKIEYELLRLLVSDMKKIFTRKEIYQSVWGNDIIVGERTLDVHMNNLRKKIGKNIIVTKKGIGFGINPEI